MMSKYFYYISKTKVDMLLSQYRSPRFFFPRVTPKIGAAGFSFEAEINSEASENLIRDTLALLEIMRKKKSIRRMSPENGLESAGFWQDEGRWFHGICSFGDPCELETYILWKMHGDNLILLIGSSQSILGAREVKTTSLTYPTHAAFQKLLDFIDQKVEPDDEHAAEDWDDGLSGDFYYYARKLVRHSIPVDEAGRPLEMPGEVSSNGYLKIPPRSLTLGVLCLKYLTLLPESQIDTVFKLFYGEELKRPEELPKWFLELHPFSREEVKKLGFEKYRKVFIGSPIYTALV